MLDRPKDVLKAAQTSERLWGDADFVAEHLDESSLAHPDILDDFGDGPRTQRIAECTDGVAHCAVAGKVAARGVDERAFGDRKLVSRRLRFEQRLADVICATAPD